MNTRLIPALFAIVLISFVMPWITVSCQGQAFLTGTGLQLLTNDLQSPMADAMRNMGGAMGESSQQQQVEEQAKVGLPVRLGTLVVLLGSLLGLLLTWRDPVGAIRPAKVVGGVQSVILLTAMVIGPSWLRSQMQGAAAASQPQEGNDMFGDLGSAMGDMMLNNIRLGFEIGFYLALAASVGLVALAYYEQKRGVAAAAPLFGPPAPYTGATHLPPAPYTGATHLPPASPDPAQDMAPVSMPPAPEPSPTPGASDAPDATP